MKTFQKRLYLAGPLFSKAELDFNRDLKNALSPYFAVYLPQEDGQLLVDLMNQGVPVTAAKKSIFSYDMAALEKADYLLIVLDGRTIDEGAAFELGVAFVLGKRCVGYQTDPRRLLPFGNNPMIDCALGTIFESREALLEWARVEGALTDQRDNRNLKLPEALDAPLSTTPPSADLSSR